jgi:hypothetical protein
MSTENIEVRHPEGDHDDFMLSDSFDGGTLNLFQGS